MQISPEEIVGPPANPTSAFPALVFSIAQMAKVYTYLGIAEGALHTARDYTLTQARPWQASGVEKSSQDPYILQQYGELWAELQAAIALADKAADQVQWGFSLHDPRAYKSREIGNWFLNREFPMPSQYS